ncbi:MAG: hypothetical protein ACTHKV_07065 [Flavipsychrobacter sp.]
MNKLSFALSLAIIIVLASACKKNNQEPQKVYLPDVRDQYTGMYNAYYIHHYSANSSGHSVHSDTAYHTKLLITAAADDYVNIISNQYAPALSLYFVGSDDTVFYRKLGVNTNGHLYLGNQPNYTTTGGFINRDSINVQMIITGEGDWDLKNTTDSILALKI